MRADAAANRQRILNAATAVFAEQGISAEIKDIADRAGIGVGTIYRNFPGKNDLLIELIRGMMREIGGALGEAEDAAEADPVAGLRLALCGMYEIAGRYGWLMEAKITGRLPDEVRQWVPPPHQDVRFQALARIMERARERGLIRHDTDIPVSILMLFVTVYPLSCGPVRGDRGTAELAETVIAIVLSGIGTDAANAQLRAGFLSGCHSLPPSSRGRAATEGSLSDGPHPPTGNCEAIERKRPIKPRGIAC